MHREMVEERLPQLLSRFADGTVAPLDGFGLVDLMHEEGINARYLPLVVSQCASLPFVASTALGEVVARCFKHAAHAALRRAAPGLLPNVAANLLNCLFSPAYVPPAVHAKSGRGGAPSSSPSLVSAADFWADLSLRAKNFFRYDLPSHSHVIQTVHALGLLRNCCIKIGLKLFARDFDLDGSCAAPFTPSDVADCVPVCKPPPLQSKDVRMLIDHGKMFFRANAFPHAFEYFRMAQERAVHTCGVLHADNAEAFADLAKVTHKFGEHAQAVQFVQSSLSISERVLGLDSAETARRYVSLSVYLFALQRHAEAWLAAQRALLLFTVLAGPKHPEIASLHITLSNIAIELKDANRMIYHANEAQKIRVAAYGSEHEAVGEVHQSTAFLYHRIGRSQIACRHMQRASAIFENKYGAHHSKTQDSLQLAKKFSEMAKEAAGAREEPAKADDGAKKAVKVK